MAQRISISPVPHHACNVLIRNGHGGTADLPAVRLPGGYATAWVPSRQALKALQGGAALTLVVTASAEGPQISLAVTPVTLT